MRHAKLFVDSWQILVKFHHDGLRFNSTFFHILMRPGTSCRPEMRPEWPWIWVAIWVAPDAKGTQQEAASPLTFHTPSSPLADWISALIPATDYWYTPTASQTPLSTTQQLADLLSFQCQWYTVVSSSRVWIIHCHEAGIFHLWRNLFGPSRLCICGVDRWLPRQTLSSSLDGLNLEEIFDAFYK